MNLHEYQAKDLLRQFGAPVPHGVSVATVEEAVGAAERMLASGAAVVVVKSQIHAGGRGKGVFEGGYRGGVQICRNAEEVRRAAAHMLGCRLVTRQTGPEGRIVRRVLIELGSKVVRELYLAVLLDRGSARPVVMGSEAGGMDIEEVAVKTPEKILRVDVDPLLGLQAFQARRLASELGLGGDLLAPASKTMLAAYRAFWECDASLVEINPLVVAEGPGGEASVLALDAKINLDANALGRHPDLLAMRDPEEEAPLEVEASKHHLNYIKLDGNIACMVNGAGLAMATMDIIKVSGGAPANFLDVGGGANRDQVAAAFRIILADPHVEGILVNIFGGIMRCDVIAEGILAAVQETGLKLPLVVRLEGTNVEAGRKLLRDSGLSVIAADSLADAAQKIVAAVKSR
ncbi:MAG: ADP-forming succinate--CoA ligase subunit beta [Verrucomicrobiae bacterium]|nr:ADP-forming succinate--CoA ligase subunit beta [Verrucomicrobiae bacterium]